MAHRAFGLVHLRISAISALRLLKELDLELPFVVVSGTIGDEVAFDLMREGCNDFILKDNLGRLERCVTRELREFDSRVERKRMSDELTASEARYRRIIETTNEGIWIVDERGLTSFMNQQMATMLGYTLAQIGQRPMADFIRIDASGYTTGNFARDHGTALKHEVTFVRSDGVELLALLDSTPVTSNTGVFEGVLSMVIDVTAQRHIEVSLRNSEEQLRQAQKMEAIGRLAGGVAHDFNNLLSVILSYADILSEQVAMDPGPLADVQEIRKASLRAAELTRQLLTFSRHDVIEARVLDVPSQLNEMFSMLPRLLGEDILLVTALAPDTGHIRAEPGQLEQIVMNLAVNARDAMPGGGKLTIASENVELLEAYARETLGTPAGPYVMVSVSDTGCGIDGATQARIFEPFFTTKEIGKGTGLGLSTVFGIAKRSGGGVCVVSEPGVGTTFKVYFPRVTAPVHTVETLRVATNLRGTETILLVEDEDEVRAAARIILRRSGYNVIEASTARNALLLCEDVGNIDMLLSDVAMPQMSGPALAQQLVKSRPATKILYMSGHTDENIARHEVLDGDIAFLQKPFTADSLRRKVRLVLDAPRLKLLPATS